MWFSGKNSRNPFFRKIEDFFSVLTEDILLSISNHYLLFIIISGTPFASYSR